MIPARMWIQRNSAFRTSTVAPPYESGRVWARPRSLPQGSPATRRGGAHEVPRREAAAADPGEQAFAPDRAPRDLALAQALPQETADRLAQPQEVVALPPERGRPVAHRAAMGAEDLAQGQRADRVQRRDERRQVFVFPQVAEALGQEEVAREEPAPSALEEAHVVGAVAGRGHDLQPEALRLQHATERPGLQAGRATPGQGAVALLHEAVADERQARRVDPGRDAALRQERGRAHVVLVVMGDGDR